MLDYVDFTNLIDAKSYFSQIIAQRAEHFKAAPTIMCVIEL